MVNDLYTKILNLPASDSLELIDPSFSPAILSNSQSAIRSQIFPINCTHEYMSFIAKGIVRLCEASSLWPLFTAIDQRQPIFLNDVTPPNLVRSLLISVPPRFSQPVTQYSDSAGASASRSPESNFLVTQEYIYDPSGTTTIGVYGVYTGIPEFGVFNSSWSVQKLNDSEVAISLDNPGGESLVTPIGFSSDGASRIVSSKLPGEQQLSLRILGPSIPSGFSCTITASNPMSYSYNDLYSRLATSPTIDDMFLSISDHSLSQRLSSLFWSPETLHDSIAAVMLGYIHSFN